MVEIRKTIIPGTDENDVIGWKISVDGSQCSRIMQIYMIGASVANNMKYGKNEKYIVKYEQNRIKIRSALLIIIALLHLWNLLERFRYSILYLRQFEEFLLLIMVIEMLIVLWLNQHYLVINWDYIQVYLRPWLRIKRKDIREQLLSYGKMILNHGLLTCKENNTNQNYLGR